MAQYGRSVLRRGYPQVDTPTGGAASSAITVTGTIVPNGTVVETAWGPHPVNPPATGWGAATTTGGNWSRVTTRPTPGGTYYLHVRIVTNPRVDVASPPVVVT
jgi:hypothetical protein